MNEFVAIIDSEGQIMLPEEVRIVLGIKPGDKILFVLGDEGQVELRGGNDSTVASVRGKAGKLTQALSWDEMRQIARDDHIDSLLRSK